jgi:hypothetical protein
MHISMMARSPPPDEPAAVAPKLEMCGVKTTAFSS